MLLSKLLVATSKHVSVKKLHYGKLDRLSSSSPIGHHLIHRGILNSYAGLSLNRPWRSQFFALRVTPPAHPKPDLVKKMLQHMAKVAEKVGSKAWKFDENGHQKPPKWRPEPSQIEPRGRQEGARTPKKPKKKIDPT